MHAFTATEVIDIKIKDKRLGKNLRIYHLTSDDDNEEYVEVVICTAIFMKNLCNLYKSIGYDIVRTSTFS